MRLLTFSSDERLELMAVSGYSHIFSTEVIQPAFKPFSVPHSTAPIG